MAAKASIYQRGEFWLDYDRGAGGKSKNEWLYICWYDRAKGRIRRKSTRERDVQLASDALDRHYLAAHRPSEAERQAYTVSEALTDYWIEHGAQVSSAESIRARLKLLTRFMDIEADAGRLIDPFTPDQIDDPFIRRFRAWAEIDPIIARRKNERGEWVESSRRKRASSTVEESVIQLKAALNHAKANKRTPHKPEFTHKTRAQVTAPRSDRLSLDGIGELLSFTMEGSGKYGGHAQRLLPLRRYIIAAVCTLARPDAIQDMSLLKDRGQWFPDAGVFDLNPSGRLQTKKYRAAIPATSLLREWIEVTDEWFVCGERFVGPKEPGRAIEQYKVGSVRSGWDTARKQLGLPQGWGPKLLRHSMATILANRRLPSTDRKLLMGHEALDGSQKAYVIFDPDYLAQARELLEGVISDLRRICPDALSPVGRP